MNETDTISDVLSRDDVARIVARDLPDSRIVEGPFLASAREVLIASYFGTIEEYPDPPTDPDSLLELRNNLCMAAAHVSISEETSARCASVRKLLEMVSMAAATLERLAGQNPTGTKAIMEDFTGRRFSAIIKYGRVVGCFAVP